ncbi:copper resistance D family protein [Actinokineospora bangkokensis]|uniref:Copper resistance protein CopD n=1 Tax=Actinokineospora bangkokensis TaxID=1193682 RepID=A0A1Q9LU68_9PSEU|nr:CopD family protein [Actinokineospora bangkokensis]OLR95551.1 copper resistance protein CopD [Actinokineospora bangkokensis]
MTETRTTTPGRRYHLVASLTAGAVLGVLVGLAITAAEPVPGLPEPPAVVRVALPLVRVLLDVAAVVTTGLCLLSLLVGFDRPKLSAPLLLGARRAAVQTSLLWVGAALATLVLQAAELRPGAPLTAASVVEYVVTIAAGKALVFVAVFGLLCFGLALWSVRAGDRVPAELLAAVALFALLPLPVTGHATNPRWHDFTMISMELHVLAAAAWTGGLGAVVVVLAANRTLLAHALPRFSKLATACVLVVTATGVFNGFVELVVSPTLGVVEGLFTTDYGLLLLLKVVCLVALGLLGAKMRYRLLPAVTAHKPTALVTWAAVELGVMGLAFGIATVLTRAPINV